MPFASRHDLGPGSALLALCLSARLSSAQTCCTTTGANELGVVERDRSAVLGVQLDHDRGYGSFNAQGTFRSLTDAEVDDIVLALGGGIRLWPRELQINGAVPLRAQYRELRGQSGAHLGLGDASLALRYVLVDGGRPGGGLSPFVEPFAGLRFPTGTPPEAASEPTLVDATGDGSLLVYVGFLVVEALGDSDAVRLSAALGHRFSRRVASPTGPQSFTPGEEITARLGFAHTLDMFSSVEAFATLRATTTAHLDGNHVTDSATHRVRVGAALAHFLAFPTWQLVGAISLDPPISHFGSNVPFAGTSLTLGLRRNFGL